MTPLSSEERRALAILAALLLLASAARWLERPRSILEDVPDVDVAALEEASRASGPARRARSEPEAERVQPEPGPIDINGATTAQLDEISGVGPALAARIVARRDSLGRFHSYEQVDSVRGVGPALLARIRAATVLR